MTEEQANAMIADTERLIPFTREDSLSQVNTAFDEIDAIFLRVGNMLSGQQNGKRPFTLTDDERMRLKAVHGLLQDVRDQFASGFYPYAMKAT